MAELVKVVVDAMGGDNAPEEPVKAAVEAVKEREDIFVILTGLEDVIKKELNKYQGYPERIQIVHTSEVIETAEPPVFAIRKKKDSSIVVGLNLVKKHEADAFVSSGSTGAVLVGGQVLVGRSKGVERPPLAPLIPTMEGVSLLIDCGANVDARPSHLVQFAKMGSIYMEHVVGIKNPRVAIVNNGAEEEKGNALVKETFPLLKEAEGFVTKFEAAMDDDFNTADALAAIFELVKFANTNVDENSSREFAGGLYEELFKLSDVLGLKIEKKEEILDKEIEDLIQERQAARKAKDFKRADEIRDELLKKGIILKDTREGVKWQRA